MGTILGYYISIITLKMPYGYIYEKMFLDPTGYSIVISDLNSKN